MHIKELTYLCLPVSGSYTLLTTLCCFSYSSLVIGPRALLFEINYTVMDTVMVWLLLETNFEPCAPGVVASDAFSLAMSDLLPSGSPVEDFVANRSVFCSTVLPLVFTIFFSFLILCLDFFFESFFFFFLCLEGEGEGLEPPERLDTAVLLSESEDS